mgnify:CR=1 FL=1
MNDSLEASMRDTLGAEYDTVVKMLEIVDEEPNQRACKERIRTVLENRADQKSKTVAERWAMNSN